MANPTRILLVSGEVAPFAAQSEVANLVRLIPEKLQESSPCEIRIMMPRYGSISERRNRLHEVIRLSGSDIPMGASKETLKVKVASIPGIRLQVYFMDSSRFFKRKGIYGEKAGKSFEDNPARALFFARAALQTVRNLGWAPDAVHAFGWMASLVPFVARTEYANDALFANARVIFTPNEQDFADRFAATDCHTFGLPQDERLIGRDFNDVGLAFADLAVYPPFLQPRTDVEERFSSDPVELLSQATSLYQPTQSVLAA